MVVDFAINIAYKVFMFFFGGFEPLRFNFDISVYSTFNNFISFIFYIIPIDGLKPIISLIISITLFRVIVSIVKTVWDLLPIL
jgi:hypothetical protein